MIGADLAIFTLSVYKPLNKPKTCLKIGLHVGFAPILVRPDTARTRIGVNPTCNLIVKHVLGLFSLLGLVQTGLGATIQ